MKDHIVGRLTKYISEARKNAKINQLSRMLKIPLFIRPPLIPEGE